VAIAKESALDREREEKAIDTLHYFVVFILGPRKDGWYFCSGASVFGLSLGDVGFFDENEGRQNHVSTSDCHGLTIYWTENKHREWWAQLDSNAHVVWQLPDWTGGGLAKNRKKLVFSVY
jgi:hypothetical protein